MTKKVQIVTKYTTFMLLEGKSVCLFQEKKNNLDTHNAN